MPIPVLMCIPSRGITHILNRELLTNVYRGGYVGFNSAEGNFARAGGTKTIKVYRGLNEFRLRFNHAQTGSGRLADELWEFFSARLANLNEPFYFYNPTECFPPDPTGTETRGRYLVCMKDPNNGLSREYFRSCLFNYGIDLIECREFGERLSMPAPYDDLYIACNCSCKVYKTDRELVEIIPPQMSGINWGCCVDKDHFYTCNVSSDRIEKRSKTGNLEVLQYTYFLCYGLCADANFLWVGGWGGYPYYGITKYNKDTLTVSRAYGDVDLGMYCPWFPIDLTVDDKYLYVADYNACRIQRWDKNTMALKQTYGRSVYWGTRATGIAVSGNSVYVAGSGCVVKANKVTWETEYILGDQYAFFTHPGDPETNLGCRDIFIHGGYLYTVGSRGIVKWPLANLSGGGTVLVPNTDAGYGTLGEYSWQACTDGSHIYVCSWDAFISKWNLATGEFVAENGDRTYETWDGPNAYNYPHGIAIDDTYIYVVDQNDCLRVIKRLKSDLSYVGEYRTNGYWEDPSGYEWSNPQGIICDNTYLYVSDIGNPSCIVMIDKTTLEFVDFVNIDDRYHGGNGTRSPVDMFIDGDYFYVSDYNSGHSTAQRYTYPGFTFVSKAPVYTDFYPEEETFMYPTGITVDNKHVYVSHIFWNGSDWEKSIRIYKKLDFSFVGSFAVTDGFPYYPAIDDDYIYFPLVNSTITVQRTDYLKKHLKKHPYTEVSSVAYVSPANYRHPISCDTAWFYQYAE